MSSSWISWGARGALCPSNLSSPTPRRAEGRHWGSGADLSSCLFLCCSGKRGVPPSTQYLQNPNSAPPLPKHSRAASLGPLSTLHHLERCEPATKGRKATGRRERAGPPAGQPVPVRSLSGAGLPLASLLCQRPLCPSPRAPCLSGVRWSVREGWIWGGSWKGLMPAAL